MNVVFDVNSQNSHYDAPHQDLFGVVASVLHLGNVEFDPDSRGHASLNNNTELRWVTTVRTWTAIMMPCLVRCHRCEADGTF